MQYRARLCARAAIIDEASSGNDVPAATMVKPIIRSLIPKAWAISTAPHTNSRELAINKIKPTTNQNTALRIGIIRTSSSCSISVPSASDFCFSYQIVHAIKPANTANNTIASTRETLPSHNCHAAKAVTKIKMGNSLCSTCECTVMGLIRAVMPRIRAMLVIFEP